MNDSAINFGKTFAQSFNEWKQMKENDTKGTLADVTLVKQFADWLDKVKFLTPHLELLAVQQVNQINVACLNALVAEVGVERAKEVTEPILAKFMHGKGQSGTE